MGYKPPKDIISAMIKTKHAARMVADITEMVQGIFEEIYDPKPFHLYHEDMGPKLWWRFPIEEPPFVGTPLDTDWPGHHTHFTAIIKPMRR